MPPLLEGAALCSNYITPGAPVDSTERNGSFRTSFIDGTHWLPMEKLRFLKNGFWFLVLLFMTGGMLIQGNLASKSVSSAISPYEWVTPEELDLAFEVPEPEPEPAPVELSIKLEHVIADLQQNPRKITPLPPEELKTLDHETLWLARCIFSETKQPREQELVAWVVRNRVETAYRGKRTYRDVILDPYQFSAFNPGNRMRTFYASLGPDSKVPGWRTAMTIAYGVRSADPVRHRPFPVKTRHFYSELSMVGQAHPEWAAGLNPVLPQRDYPIDARRFRFYADIW